MNFLKIKKTAKAFTLVELLVSVGIFAFMTSLMVAKYGNFNQSVLLTNLAYDVAVTIRTAQSYGLSVKSPGGGGGDASQFQNAYGVQFDSGIDDDKFYLFADTDEDEYYIEGQDELISTYNLKRGAEIKWVCAGSGGCSQDEGVLTILFKRPDPSAVINFDSYSGSNLTSQSYAEIIIKGTDDNTRVVKIRENGQISVGE